MKRYEPKDIRTIALIGHGGSGKTSVGEALLYLTGANSRLGAVDDQTALLDHEPEEHKRGGSISTSFGTIEHDGVKINFADTPGDGNFILDARAALLGVDAAVAVVSAVDGVEVNTERTYGYATDSGLPVAVFVNKMDRERANGQQAVDDITELLGVRAVPLQVPVGAEADFKGVCDLVTGKLLTFAADGSGKVTEGDIPADLADAVEAATEVMVEAAAEADEELLEKYLEEGELSPEEIRIGLLAGIRSGSFVPVIFGAATRNFGVSSLLDLIEMFPCPLDGAARAAHDGEEEKQIAPDPSGSFAGLVVKTLIDPFSGKLNVFRVMSGEVEGDTNVYNASAESKERFGQIFHLVGKKTVPVGHAVVGDLVAVAKLKDTNTFDTLTADKSELRFDVYDLPAPMITYIVTPKSKGDEDKIKSGLQRLIEEDPTLSSGHDEMTSSITISGMGQQHIDMAVEQLKRKYGVELEMELPPVPYKETIRGSVRIQGRHKKQTGGRGQFGDTWQRISPLPRGGGFEFVSEIVGGAIPRQFIPAVEKGIVEAMARGPVAGYPVVDVQVVLDDGTYHKVDSSEMAFKMAGSKGFKKGFLQCSPTLLEPILEVEIVVPEENVGDIMGDVNGRRGKVLSMDPKGRSSVIKAHIPHAEMLEYSKVLQSVTGGKGTYTMAFHHNEEVPAHLQQQIISASPFKQTDDDE